MVFSVLLVVFSVLLVVFSVLFVVLSVLLVHHWFFYLPVLVVLSGLLVASAGGCCWLLVAAVGCWWLLLAARTNLRCRLTAASRWSGRSSLCVRHSGLLLFVATPVATTTPVATPAQWAPTSLF